MQQHRLCRPWFLENQRFAAATMGKSFWICSSSYLIMSGEGDSLLLRTLNARGKNKLSWNNNNLIKENAFRYSSSIIFEAILILLYIYFLFLISFLITSSITYIIFSHFFSFLFLPIPSFSSICPYTKMRLLMWVDWVINPLTKIKSSSHVLPFEYKLVIVLESLL